MDIAIQEYGDFTAIKRLLENNPHLVGLNDYPDGQVPTEENVFDIAHAILPNVTIYIDDVDLNQSALKELNGKTIISE